MAGDSVPRIRACLFDMDGLLIDSEDKYTECTNEILQQYGRPNLPWTIKAQLQGRPHPQATRIFEEWAQLPVSHNEYIDQLRKRQAELFPTCKPLPGAARLLQTLHNHNKTTRKALATSSHRYTFDLKTLPMKELFSVFQERNRVLGDDPRIPKGRGKPAPDIYLLALKTLNVENREKGEPDITPAECLVFEDSVPGVESGRRAGMQVVWCPHPELLKIYAGRESEVLAGLTGEHKESEVTPVGESAGQRVAGAPGTIDDGYAILIRSLEDFPYSKYGLKEQ